LDGKITNFAEPSEKTYGKLFGLAFGPDGRLYAAMPDTQQIAAFDPVGKLSVVASGQDLRGVNPVVAHNGNLYSTWGPSNQLFLLKSDGTQKLMDSGDLHSAPASSFRPIKPCFMFPNRPPVGFTAIKSNRMGP